MSCFTVSPWGQHYNNNKIWPFFGNCHRWHQSWKKNQNFPGIWSKIALQIFRNFWIKRPKYPSKWSICPQNFEYFPPKAKFTRIEIPKFRIFSCMGDILNVSIEIFHLRGTHFLYYVQITTSSLAILVCYVPKKNQFIIVII